METWFAQLELKLSTLHTKEEARQLFLHRVRTSTVDYMRSSTTNFTISSEETACVRRYLMMLRDIEEENKGLYKVLHSITTEKIDLSAARKWLTSDVYLRVARLEGCLRARKSG